jgi:hypothetical protein
MKLTVRTLAFASALGVGLIAANSANAQSIAFSIRQGGTALPGGVLEMLAPGPATVEVWLTNTGQVDLTIAVVDVMFGFSKTSGTGTSATRLDSVISPSLTGGTMPGSFIQDGGSGMNITGGNGALRAASATTGNNPVGPQRPWGGYTSWTILGGRALGVGESMRMAIYNIDVTGSYGELAGETGLVVYHSGTLTGLGNSKALATSGFPAITSVTGDRVVISVVPEPATMLVLGAGIAALAARRRRKS